LLPTVYRDLGVVAKVVKGCIKNKAEFVFGLEYNQSLRRLVGWFRIYRPVKIMSDNCYSALTDFREISLRAALAKIRFSKRLF